MAKQDKTLLILDEGRGWMYPSVLVVKSEREVILESACISEREEWARTIIVRHYYA